MDPKFHEIDKKLAVLLMEFRDLKGYVMGNDKRGLGDRVAQLEHWRWYISGGLAVLSLLVAWFFFHEVRL